MTNIHDAMYAAQMTRIIVKEPTEQLAWDIYYASICAMYLHPGNKDQLNLTALADIADQMVIERRQRGL